MSEEAAQIDYDGLHHTGYINGKSISRAVDRWEAAREGKFSVPSKMKMLRGAAKRNAERKAKKS